MFGVSTDVCNVYTREAGPGLLSVAVEGPGKAEIKLENRPNGFLGVNYKVPRSGTNFFKKRYIIFGFCHQSEMTTRVTLFQECFLKRSALKSCMSNSMLPTIFARDPKFQNICPSCVS